MEQCHTIWSGPPPGLRETEDEPSFDARDAVPTLEGPFMPTGGGGFPAVIVCPGGGYRRRAPHEGAEVARRLADAGIAAWVLHYRVWPWRHPAAVADAQRAIRLLRHRASELAIRSDQLGILGFSAGGHVAASAAYRWNEAFFPAADAIDGENARPDFCVLGYPVLSGTHYAHEGSWKNALGTADWTARSQFGVARYVSPDSPPSFLWSTSNDQAVPVPNTYELATALFAAGVRHEVHVYREGRHGLGLAEGHVARWFDATLAWLGEELDE